MNGTLQITIPNKEKLLQALRDYPSIATPVVQNAVVSAQALLAKHTNPSTVPIRTRYLLQNWGFEVGPLWARFFPKAVYAPYVEFGTRPHVIEPKSLGYRGHPGGLGNRKTGFGVFNRVNHPGTKANPFMERILASATPDIEGLFVKALELITERIAAQAS